MCSSGLAISAPGSQTMSAAVTAPLVVRSMRNVAGPSLCKRTSSFLMLRITSVMSSTMLGRAVNSWRTP